MKTTLLTLGASFALALAPAHAQEEPSPEAPGHQDEGPVIWIQEEGEPGEEAASVRVAFIAKGQERVDGALPMDLLSGRSLFRFDEPATRAGLGLEDLDARMVFVDDLLDALRQDRKGREVVREWLRTESAKAGELAWTSRMLIRELDQIDVAIAFEVLDPTMERIVLRDMAGLTELHDLRGARKHEVIVEQDLDTWMQGTKNRVNVFPSAPVAGGELMSVELRIMPSMTRLRIMGAPQFAGTAEDAAAPGTFQIWNTQIQEFSGQNLATILTSNPELAARLPFGLQSPQSSSRETLRTDILGVHTRGLRLGQGAKFGLDADVGLEVVRIEPGTIAQLLGVDPGSIVLEVCGTTVEGTNGIADAIGGPVGSEVCVVWIDSFGKRRERTWRNVIRTLHVEGAEGLIEFDVQELEEVTAAPAPDSEPTLDRVPPGQ